MNNCAFLWLFKKQEKKTISERKSEFSTFTTQIGGGKEGNELLSHTAQPSVPYPLQVLLSMCFSDSLSSSYGVQRCLVWKSDSIIFVQNRMLFIVKLFLPEQCLVR